MDKYARKLVASSFVEKCEREAKHYYNAACRTRSIVGKFGAVTARPDGSSKIRGPATHK